MHKRVLGRAPLGLVVRFLLGAALLVVVGCDPIRDGISRVQPNFVDKNDLNGQWYYQRTVVDMPASNGFTFIGSTDTEGLTRVTWDIQESYLYARRHTELIKDADGKGTVEQNGGRYQGGASGSLTGDAVGLGKGFAQALGGRLAPGVVIGGQQGLDGQLAGYLAGRQAAHAIGDGVEPASGAALRRGGLAIAQVVFVVLAHAARVAAIVYGEV